MEHCLRWYGPEDPVELAAVRQAGATGVVTALHQVPNGETWPQLEIETRKRQILEGSPDRGGLHWAVVESLPVHEEIKFGGPQRPHLLDNYRESLVNLAACGIRTVCYNFMPVLDWTRTDLEHRWFDGSVALAFSLEHLVAFDLFILERAAAADDYPAQVCQKAKVLYDGFTREQKDSLCRTVAAGLPGSEESYGIEELKARLADYSQVDADLLQENLVTFLEEVVPVAQELGMKLAIHPDDPPLPLLGLPRVVSNAEQIGSLLTAVDSPANGLTFCTGSLGAHPANDTEAMAERFADRTHFVPPAERHAWEGGR